MATSSRALLVLRWIVCVPAGVLAYVVATFALRALAWIGLTDAYFVSSLAEDTIPPAVWVLTTAWVAPWPATGAFASAAGMVMLSALSVVTGASQGRDWWFFVRVLLVPTIGCLTAWAVFSAERDRRVATTKP